MEFKERKVDELKKVLDFRFADDEDAEDIILMVNSAYEHEVVSADGVGDGFRTSEPLFTLAMIESDFTTPSTRWLVLETPRPEEKVVASARVRMASDAETDQRTCLADVLCSIGDTPDEQRSRYNQLRLSLEKMAYSQGVSRLSVEIPQWREAEQLWLEASGFQDREGRMWPSDRANQVCKHTMILEFRKELTGPPTAEPKVGRAIESSSSTSGSGTTSTTTALGIDLAGLSVTKEGGTSGSGDAMEGLVASLITALHSEM
jgi:hypothetical protein